MTTKPPLQMIVKRILHTEDQNEHNHERTGILNLKRRTDKYPEETTELATHTQIVKQQNH
jgi:hypothetical protein